MQNKKSGRVFTVATLTQTVDTLLPETEFVFLALWENDKPRRIGVVPFAALRATLGDRIVRTTLWPPRYRVSTFPLPAELKTLNPQLVLP